MREPIIAVCIGTALALAATFAWVPTRFNGVTLERHASGQEVVHLPKDPYPPIEYRVAWVDGLHPYYVPALGAEMPAVFRVAWLVVLAEQAAILLVALGALVLLIRRARRRATLRVRSDEPASEVP